jgi:hypothetical protein
MPMSLQLPDHDPSFLPHADTPVLAARVDHVLAAPEGFCYGGRVPGEDVEAGQGRQGEDFAEGVFRGGDEGSAGWVFVVRFPATDWARVYLIRGLFY